MSSGIIAKVVLIGDGRVGKTSIRRRFMGKGFTVQHLMTLGADFSEKAGEIEINHQKMNYTLQIWDIAGQDSFMAVRKRFLANAAAIIVVYDITNPQSFHSLGKWINEVWKVNNDITNPILIIGNKTDLVNQRMVENSSVTEFYNNLHTKYPKIHSINYIETSALTGENISEGFELITRSIYNKRKDK